MIKETFSEYMNRVSRARHILMSLYGDYEYYWGASNAYRTMGQLVSQGKENNIRKSVEYLEGSSRRYALIYKTVGLIAQDRVLTYREETLL